MSNPLAYLRVAHAGWVLTREGVIAALPADGLGGPARFGHGLARLLARRNVQSVGRAERLARAVDRLGPSYVKLCQFLATRPDVVGDELATQLRVLQDKLDPFPTDQARAEVAKELDADVDDVFSEFSDSVAAASIAARALWDAQGPGGGVELAVYKGVPLQSGMGSSAASAVAAVVAVNALLEQPLAIDALLRSRWMISAPRSRNCSARKTVASPVPPPATNARKLSLKSRRPR